MQSEPKSSHQNQNGKCCVKVLRPKNGKKTEITNSQNTKRTYGQPSEQLFPSHLATQTDKKTSSQKDNDRLPENKHFK